jgi:co-chaperonin GroES (HSP10)
MNITPKKGYVLVSNQDIVEEKKLGSLILPGEEKRKTYLKVESDGEFYFKDQCVFAHPFKSKMQIEENLYLIAEEDIVASFTL